MNSTVRLVKRVGVGLLACSLILAAALNTRRDRVVLTLEISSSVSSVAQVFYDTGSGYRQSESSTTPVSANTAGRFSRLRFDLPDGVKRLRFDPLMTPGRFVIRDVELRAPGGVLHIAPQSITPLNQVVNRVETGPQVAFDTTPGANDPGVLLAADVGHALNRFKLKRSLRLFLLAWPALAVGAALALFILRNISSGGLIGRVLTAVHSAFGRLAQRLSLPHFIPFDAYAIWFYVACSVLFLTASLLDLNGSSAPLFHSIYGLGAQQEPWIGAARQARSDEWAYVTPNILNQTFRTDRFEARDSELGNHYAALTGNIPVRHFSTFFRPQLWPFFLFRVDYAYAFNWQAKALLLVTGVFTWLLLITQSTAWAATGALWFFFSPATQWSYSWPSALPEMIGSVCFAVVLACLLTVSGDAVALALGSAGLVLCCVNFAMCSYVPHMVPLFWLAVIFFAGWCLGHRQHIFRREAAVRRLAAVAITALAITAVASLLYLDLREAITAISQTVYPGKRAFRGGLYPAYALGQHFLAWTEREDHFPSVLTNICEGSGYLWLAPVTLLCLWRMRLTRQQCFYLLALWAVFCFLLAWLILPLPVSFGSLFGLQQTAGARILPALGLANVAIVTLCMASFRTQVAKFGTVAWWTLGGTALLASAAMLLILLTTNKDLSFFFNTKEVLFASLATGLPIALLINGRRRAFALCLLLPQAILFGAINPVEQALPVFTSSDLLAFVRTHPQLRQGKWLVFSDSVVSSGFLAATGCEVYTGTRYLPDIDHFALFAARHYNVSLLNRGGYLIAHLRSAAEPARIEVSNPAVMQWDVTPDDLIVRQLGIKYIAFQQLAAPLPIRDLVPLAPRAVDGFWLYRLR